MNNFASNIKFLRNSKSWSQQVFADKVGVARSTVADYERKKSEPNLETLITISKTFGTSIDDIVKKNLQADAYTIIKNKHMKVLAITVDDQNRENIELVPQKAQAGYTTGYGDVDFIAELPKIHLPQLNSGTFRAFEITGDSMLPIPSGSIILGSYVEELRDVKENKPYVVVTFNEGIVFKRIEKSGDELRLVSDNPDYMPYNIPKNEVLELWSFEAYVNFEYNKPNTLDRIERKLDDMQEWIKQHDA